MEEYLKEFSNKRYPFIIEGRDIRVKEDFDFLYKKQRETNDEELKEKMILANMPFIFSVILRHTKGRYPGKFQVRELITPAYIGAERAFELYNPGKNNKFLTYMAYGVLSKILEETTPRKEEDLSFEELTETEMDDYSNETEKIKRDRKSETYFRKIEDDMSFETYLKIGNLTEREREILELRSGRKSGKHSLEEISNIYKVTKEAIRKTERRAHAKIIKGLEALTLEYF